MARAIIRLSEDDTVRLKAVKKHLNLSPDTGKWNNDTTVGKALQTWFQSNGIKDPVKTTATI